MSDFETKLAKELSDREYRDSYGEAFSNEYLAAQIQMLRKRKGWTQADLGTRIQSNQGRVSVYEDPDYGKWSLDTLRKLASEFGLWFSFRFESVSTLVHEASHFNPANLLRDEFDQDPRIAELLDGDVTVDALQKTRRLVRQWAASPQPNSLTLAGWLQGDLPDLELRETTPSQRLLTMIPESDTVSWSAITDGLAHLLRQGDEILPILQDTTLYWDSLFSLAAAKGPLPELQNALDVVYATAMNRHRSHNGGNTGLGYQGEQGLLLAMLCNQVDDRWKADVWYRYYLRGSDYPMDFKSRPHPFLPGNRATGIRGLLELPQADEQTYWQELAFGVRELEQRFLERDRRSPANGLTATPNIMDEMIGAIATIFDRWNEPAAAKDLIFGSMELIQKRGDGGPPKGGWFMYSQSAWAYEVQRRGWDVAVTSSEHQRERVMLLHMIVSGLDLFGVWNEAARSQPSLPGQQTAGFIVHMGGAARDDARHHASNLIVKTLVA